MILRSLIILTFLLSTTSYLPAQKVIQLEKRGSYKTQKIYIGSQLHYKLRADQRTWLQEYITDIDTETGYIFLEHRTVHIDSIYAIQIRSARQAVKSIAGLLTGFSYTWSFWALVSVALGDPLQLGTVIVGVGSFAIGQLLRLAFFKTYRFKGKKRRIRLVDLTFYQPVPQRT